ncbi:hypothetical protein HAX54_017968 [Datura stramonium]|uniref:Uncharacterized protein n=1 Tax=Datura stramonium TaxID=4076 RepID=A0ABS8UPC3_DATST|nr:hypothetical protein [Datura stramonium]
MFFQFYPYLNGESFIASSQVFRIVPFSIKAFKDYSFSSIHFLCQVFQFQVSIIMGLFILQNEAVRKRGAADGVAMTGMSFFKALGPARGGALCIALANLYELKEKEDIEQPSRRKLRSLVVLQT